MQNKSLQLISVVFLGGFSGLSSYNPVWIQNGDYKMSTVMCLKRIVLLKEDFLSGKRMLHLPAKQNKIKLNQAKLTFIYCKYMNISLKEHIL